MLTSALAQQIAQTWLDDWNRHDLDAIMTHYAESIIFSSPFISTLTGNNSGQLNGKAALRDYFAKGLAAFPDLHFTPIQILVGVNSLALFYDSVNNLQAAEVMTINADRLVTQVLAHYSMGEP